MSANRAAGTAGASPTCEARQRRVRRDLLLLIFGGLVLFGAGLGLRDPWPPDEPRFALVAKEMADSGDWLFPHRNGELYPDKPPMFMWMIAGGYLLTGSMRVAFLMPSLLAGLATTLLVYDSARRLWNRRIAWVAGVALLVTVQFVLQARAAQIDCVLTFFITLGIYGLVRHLLLGPAWGWWVVAFAAMGAGVITKGVGFLPVLMLIPYAWGHARGWPGLPRIRWSWWRMLLGPVMLVAVVGSWLVPMLAVVAASGDPALAAYRDNILLRQTAVRFVAAWHHERWLGYYLFQVVPWAWLPISLALPWLIGGWRRRVLRRDPRTWLPVCWAVLVLAFFSVSPGKRGVYILPVIPAIVLAAAPLLPGIVRLQAARRAARGGVFFFSGVFTAFGLAVLHAPAPIERALSHYSGQPGVIAVPILLLGCLGIVLGLCLWRRPVTALASLFVVLWLFAGWWINPELNRFRSAAPVMREVERITGREAEIAIVAWREQFVLHSVLPITTFGYAREDLDSEAVEAAAWAEGGPRTRWVMLPQTVTSPCFDAAAVTILGRRYGRVWCLAPGSSVTDACRTLASP